MTFIVLSGLFYNVGLLAAPWFESKLAQRLADILGGSETAAAMAMPAHISPSRWRCRQLGLLSVFTSVVLSTISTDV